MSTAVGVLNLLLGLVYLCIGVLTIIDLRQNWRSRGPSHFGLALTLLAFTCGPHHLEHGVHVLTTPRVGGGLDLLVVSIGLPAGLVWFLLRLEAANGGRGDRRLVATPAWVESIPTAYAAYSVAMVTAVAMTLTSGARFDARLTPNLALIVLYLAIGVVLTRTQLNNHRMGDGWSMSGLSLTGVFPTCAWMHAIWAVYGATGQYDIDSHLLIIDSLSVPVAMYFLWVVWSLSTGRLNDWNRNAGDAATRQPVEVDVVASPVGVLTG